MLINNFCKHKPYIFFVGVGGGGGGDGVNSIG